HHAGPDPSGSGRPRAGAIAARRRRPPYLAHNGRLIAARALPTAPRTGKPAPPALSAPNHSPSIMHSSSPSAASGQVSWTENDVPRRAGWPAAIMGAAPRRIVIADDTMSADTAFRLASQGTSLLWRGDFQN